jgi:hypothetical protein
MEKSSAINIIKSRSFVATPGAYELQVTSVTPFNDKMIVNLKAMTQYHIEQAKELLSQGETQLAVNQCITANLRMTDYIPSKGEFVKCQIDNVTTKNDVTGLFVVSLTELKAKTNHKVSFDFDDVEVEQTQFAAPSQNQPKTVF